MDCNRWREFVINNNFQINFNAFEKYIEHFKKMINNLTSFFKIYQP